MDGAGATALWLAGVCCLLAALAHLACIAIGPAAFRFMGAGERMARAAQRVIDAGEAVFEVRAVLRGLRRVGFGFGGGLAGALFFHRGEERLGGGARDAVDRPALAVLQKRAQVAHLAVGGNTERRPREGDVRRLGREHAVLDQKIAEVKGSHWTRLRVAAAIGDKPRRGSVASGCAAQCVCG